MNKIKNGSKGFTLLELLVVVLIIGILAAIALPQYHTAVGKARLATLKNITKSIQQSAQRYYIINNEYPYTSAGLDIDLNIKSETSPNSGLEMTMEDGVDCKVWHSSSSYISCYRNIFNRKVSYYINRETGRPLYCLVESGTPKTDKAAILCAKETGDIEAGSHPTYIYQ